MTYHGLITGVIYSLLSLGLLFGCMWPRDENGKWMHPSEFKRNKDPMSHHHYYVIGLLFLLVVMISYGAQ